MDNNPYTPNNHPILPRLNLKNLIIIIISIIDKIDNICVKPTNFSLCAPKKIGVQAQFRASCSPYSPSGTNASSVKPPSSLHTRKEPYLITEFKIRWFA